MLNGFSYQIYSLLAREGFIMLQEVAYILQQCQSRCGDDVRLGQVQCQSFPKPCLKPWGRVSLYTIVKPRMRTSFVQIRSLRIWKSHTHI